MSAGSGTTLIKIEPPRDADLRNALTIEQANGQMYRAVIQSQAATIDQQNLLINRLRSRSGN